MSWVGTGGNSADFTVKSSFIRSGYSGTAPDGFPAIGDIISESIGGTAFDYGDATGTGQLQYRVDAINVAENFLIGTALEPGTTNDLTLSHLYDTPGPFRALISSCCNIGDLQNNPDGSYSVGADVDFSGDTQSPVTSVPPVVTVGNAGSQAFFVQASDPGGQTLRWRLATAAEACAGACADPQPPGLAINANTGQITWDTTGLTIGLYQASVVIEALSGGGDVVSSTQVTFLIRVADPSLNNPPVFRNPSPPDGEVFDVAPGDRVCINLAADDVDAGDIVDIIPGGLPAGATFQDVLGNPATGRFEFVPTAAQDGDDIILNFTAQDNKVPPGADLRSYTIRVRAGAPAASCPPPPPSDYSSYYYSDCPTITTIDGITVQGDNAPNTITGTPRNDLLRGGGGNDAITGLPGDDCINGQDGNDVMNGDDGSDTIIGSDGNDQATGSPGNDTIDLGNGNDSSTGDAGNDSIVGGSGVDSISGNNDNDLIKGFGDNDKVSGNGGKDRVQGSGGNDKVKGSNGRDKVRGGTGKDKVNGDKGNDQVQSQGGKDKIVGGSGKDNIRAGGANDKVKAADGDRDKVKCGLGDDKATVDAIDVVANDCEKVRVKKK